MTAGGPRLRQRIRRLFRPPRRLKTTRLGKTYVVVTVGVGIGALNTGNNLLFLLLGFFLALIVISGLLSERVLRDLEVQRVGAEDAFAREPFGFRWTVRAGRSSLFALRVEEDDQALQAVAHLGYLPAGAERTLRAEALVSSRGPIPLSAIKVTTAYPFGLFEKSRRFDQAGTLLVYPRPVASTGRPRSEESPGLGSFMPNGARGGGGDLIGLRLLDEGESVQGIHWRKSAALGKLVRAERERDEQKTFLLEVHPTPPNQALDHACEEAAATARALLEQGHQVGLSVGAKVIRPACGPAQERRVLQALAWAGFGDGEQAG